MEAWFDDGSLETLGQGHIHDTYKVQSGGESFVLQRVNEYVFRDGDLVMRQTERLLACWAQQSRYVVPELVSSKAGTVSYRDDTSLWRVWRFIANTRTIDPIKNVSQAESVGCAFGELQNQLVRLEGPPLADTIEGFLDLNYYLDAYAAVADKAPRDLQLRVEKHRHLGAQLSNRQTHIHGDCKVNNVLFRTSQDEVVAIIDFDTAMYGHWAWDFGDLIRSICFSVGGYRAELFEACLRGFGGAQPLTNAKDAVLAPQYVALMLGVRFLTDHLQGDVYFKTQHSGQNLIRAREQFAVFDAFLTHRSEMLEIADRVLTSR